MNTLPILVIVVIAFACNLSERLNTAMIVADAEVIREGEAKFHVKERQYGSLATLANAGLIDAKLADGKDVGYSIELSAENDRYVLLIAPDHSQATAKSHGQEQLSIYCDETGVLRGSIDPNHPADKSSSEMQPKHD